MLRYRYDDALPGSQVLPEHDMLGLGAIAPATFVTAPAAAAASTRAPSAAAKEQGAAPAETYVAGGGPTGNDVCTSDRFLAYLNGAWRIRSLTDDSNAANCPSGDYCSNCGGGVIFSEDSSYVYNSGQHIYAGPFPINLGNKDGQINTLYFPAQLGSDWGTWIGRAIDTAITSIISVRKGADCAGHENDLNPPSSCLFGKPPLETSLYPNTAPVLSLLPRIVGATQDYYDDGSATGAPISTYPGFMPCNYVPYPYGCAGTTCTGQALNSSDGSMNNLICGAITALGGAAAFDPVPIEYAADNHTLHPIKAWFSTDADGFRVTNVQYSDDAQTYTYYSHAQWLQALGANLGQQLNWLSYDADLASSNTTQFNRNKDLAPFAKITLPNIPIVPNTKWGLWLSVPYAPGSSYATTGAGGRGMNSPEGIWDPGISGPAFSVFQVGMGPLPQEGWWDKFIDWLDSIPTALLGGLVDVGSFLSSVMCDVSKFQAGLSTIKDPSTKAELTAAFLVASEGCPKPPAPLPCSTNPNQAQCMPAVPVSVPWYKKWWVWALAAGAVGAVVLMQQPSSASPTSSTPA